MLAPDDRVGARSRSRNSRGRRHGSGSISGWTCERSGVSDPKPTGIRTRLNPLSAWHPLRSPVIAAVNGVPLVPDCPWRAPRTSGGSDGGPLRTCILASWSYARRRSDKVLFVPRLLGPARGVSSGSAGGESLDAAEALQLGLVLRSSPSLRHSSPQRTLAPLVAPPSRARLSASPSS